jgi:hypothetical protein
MRAPNGWQAECQLGLADLFLCLYFFSSQHVGESHQLNEVDVDDKVIGPHMGRETRPDGRCTVGSPVNSRRRISQDIFMRTEKHQKVLEKLATNDKATIVIERQMELKCALRQGLG